MKYFTLVALFATSALLTNCCHTRYTEAKDPATAVFNVGDRVYLSPNSLACQMHVAVCIGKGVVVETLDIKNECYPKASYEIKFYNEIDTLILCADQLILIKRAN